MNAINQEEKILRDLFKAGEVQTPPCMTEKVMHKIDNNTKIFEYEPVISKKGWTVIGSAFAAILVLLIAKTGGFTIQSPELLQFISENFSGLGKILSFELDIPTLRFPEIPSTMLISIGALNIIGIYLIISYKWQKRMFRH
ncbi:hypothetical protein [Ekhidna sp.]|uniref:hypothetical protein n=1 Tax=Ekhidna sp. TaxID=2608089 RepID=UPI003C7AE945